jgi:hypothetical protein
LLKKHGHKLYELQLKKCFGLDVLGMCPNLNVFKLGSLGVSQLLSFIYPVVHGRGAV